MSEPVGRERLDAAKRSIEGVKAELRRWDWVNLQSTQTTFAPQIRKLDEALELLDQVKLHKPSTTA